MKKIFYALFLGIFLFIGTNSVGAIMYNGGGTSSGSAGKGDCSDDMTKYCQFNNDNHKTIKVSLYYFDANQNRTQIGHSYYLSNNPSAITAALGIAIDNIYTVAGLTWENARSQFEVNGNLTEASFNNALQYFGVSKSSLTNKTVGACSANGKEYGYRIIIEPAMTVYLKGNYYLKTIKEIADYRIDPTTGAVLTTGLSNSAHWKSDSEKLSVAMYTYCNDVGISAVAASSYTADQVKANFAIDDVATIGNPNTGYGYNIIDIPESLLCTKCWKIISKGTKASCDNTGKLNEGNFKEEVAEYCAPPGESCADDDKNVTIFGKLKEVRVNGKTCRFYCLDSATQSFPGNISKAISINPGSHLIWPTSTKTIATVFQNNYSLTFKGKLTCVLHGDDDLNTCKNVPRSKLYNFTTNATVSWDDGTGTTKTVELKKVSDVKYKKTQFANIFSWTATVSYKLPDKYNRYVDKNGNYSDNASRLKNYTDLKYGNLPVSYDAKVNKSYNLSIINTKLGNTKFGKSSGSFGDLLNNYTYTCKYTPTDTASTCACPTGTEQSGEYIKIASDGSYAILDTNTTEFNYEGYAVACGKKLFKGEETVETRQTESKYIACAEAQEVLCDVKSKPDEPYQVVLKTPDSPDEEDEPCDCYVCKNGINKGINLKCDENCRNDVDEDGNPNICNNENITSDDYCEYKPLIKPICVDSSGQIHELDACVRNGMSSEECIRTFCPNGIAKEYKCTDIHGVKKSTDACVQTKVAQGISLDDATNECDKIVCGSGNGSGNKIIYRVIDLSNPFPSYNADATVAQSGLRRGMFNDNLKGRYPGTNWNNKTTVKREILKNRNVDGDKVYDADPMYVFTLDSNTIKAIRRYNKTTTYDDFELNCKLNNSIACVSSFIHNHNRDYGLTGGVYSGTLDGNNFYSHDNISN